MQSDQTERRRFFRVDDNISLSYRLIDEETAAKGLRSEAVLSGEFTLSAALDVLSQEAVQIMRHMEKPQPEVMELYKVLDAKINAIAQAMMLMGSHINTQNCQQVNLSASGLAFEQATPLDIGQYMAIEMYLPSALTLIKLYGKVVKCDLDEAGQYYICVDYTDIREDDQELLIKHVVRTQWEQLRQQKSQS